MSDTYYPPFRFDGHGINDKHGVRVATFDSLAKDQARNGLGDQMAAAPELLEALEWAEIHLHKLLPGSNILADVRAAIAKARGQA